jgi:hypothetical protein
MIKLHLREMSPQFGFVLTAVTTITMASLFGVFGDSTIPKHNNGTHQSIHRQWVM